MEDMTKYTKIESTPQPPADYLNNDPRFRELLQEASKDSIRSDTSGYMGRQGYSWNEKGGIVDKEGHDVSPSQLIGPAQIEGVTDAAKREFSDRYQKDFGVYEGREKIRVYESPSSDPAYSETEREVTRVTNQKSNTPFGSVDSLGDKRRLRDREEELVSIAHWGKFVSEYPEKASAYASKNEYIAKAIAEEEKRKKYWEGVEKSKQIEKDEARIQEIRLSLKGEPALKQEVPLDTSGIGDPIITDSRWDEFRGKDNKFISRNGEDIYKNFWSDDPELKTVRENIKTETQKRLDADKSVHENFSDKYRIIFNGVRNEQWSAFVAKYPEKAKSYQEYYKEIRDILNPPEPMNPEVLEKESSVVEVASEPLVVEKVAEVDNSKKVEDSLSKEDVILNYLAYQDTSASPEQKKAWLKYSEKSESASKYATALQEIFSSNPKAQIEKIASHVVAEATDILKKFGVSGSPILESKTWAMWDIGKQYYYATHQDEADNKYSIANPLKSPEKVTEIIDRHVGWETYRTKDKKFTEKFKKHPLYSKLQEFLNKPPKNTNGELSSKDLAELGSLIRKIVK